MTERQFYRRALWLPIVVPLAAGILLMPALYFARDWSLASSVSEVLLFLVAIPGAYALLPYLVIAALLYRNLSRSKRILWGHPLLTVLLVPPLAGALWSVYLLARGDLQAWVMIVLGCEFGYPYALAVALAALVGEKAGWITRESQVIQSPVALR